MILCFSPNSNHIQNNSISTFNQSSSYSNCADSLCFLSPAISSEKYPFYEHDLFGFKCGTFVPLMQDQFTFSFIFCDIKMENDESAPKEETIKCLTSKEVKTLVRPQFEANPDKYYPTETFKKMGFSRAQCKCGHFYWRKSEKATTCGDSNCRGQYSFIGKGCGVGLQKKITYKQAWDSFEKSFTTARIPCTKIDRYPVIARWRNDVDYVAAGIFCFQPFCVTGQLDPPANPLICPQFCLRFNDLDNIGLTGRHYSGFVMCGIQVFNKPDNFIFFKDEVLEFNYKWLTEGLKIDPEEITFIEDIWAGGGNLGPCIQYFIHGLQVGNMVFMQFKHDHEGKIKQLPVQVIDVGVGLERIPWLLNGSSTSYLDVFSQSFEFMKKHTNFQLDNETMNRLGPYTCKLNIDEVENIDQTWDEISKIIDLPADKVKQAILPVKDLYVVLDHTRTVLVIISDGGLPSNTGGGSNCRNVLRRVFAIMKKYGWWDQIGGLDGLLQLFEAHRRDLAKLYGPFPEYKSFGDIITIEYERWANTESAQKKKLQQLVSKNKGKLALDQWIMAIQSWGIPADAISQICKLPVPDTLYYQIALRAQKVAKATEFMLYDTIKYPETENLYYKDHRLSSFDAKVIAVLVNVEQKDKGTNIIILDRSAFYPTSGGQVHDLGQLTIGDKVHQVYDVQKVGPCFLHYLNQPVEVAVGTAVQGLIDVERRNTLRSFHTGTHIVYAASRRVLGPHIWQNGAKKTQNYAHLDITHYSSITKQIQLQIQNQANRIILESHPISKYFQNKKEAQGKHGFNLYQGGIVPGNTIRVVNIEGVDVEACCGTHCDNTSEVGWIKIYKSARISDGILRLYYVANKKVLKALNQESTVINNLKDLWGINQNQIVQTAKRFFEDYKKYQKETQHQKLSLLAMHSRYICQSKLETFVVPSLEKELTLYFSNLKTNLTPIVESKKTAIFINDQFFFAIVSAPEHLDLQKLKALVKEDEVHEVVDKKWSVKKGMWGKNKHEKTQVISYVGNFKQKKILDYLTSLKYTLLK